MYAQCTQRREFAKIEEKRNMFMTIIYEHHININMCRCVHLLTRSVLIRKHRPLVESLVKEYTLMSPRGNTTFFLYFYRTRVRSLGMLVSNSLTNWLTNCCLVNLIDVTLACEDANSKLVEVVTIADVDAKDHAGKSFLIGELTFGHEAKLLFRLWAQGLVKILKLRFRQILKLEFG